MTLEAGTTDMTPTALRRDGSFDGRRALVVDDNETNRRLMGALLGAWGVQTVLAPGAEPAMAALDDGRVDVAVLDMLMPDVDGLELAAKLHAKRPDLPVVLASSVSPARRGGRSSLGGGRHRRRCDEADQSVAVARGPGDGAGRHLRRDR